MERQYRVVRVLLPPMSPPGLGGARWSQPEGLEAAAILKQVLHLCGTRWVQSCFIYLMSAGLWVEG